MGLILITARSVATQEAASASTVPGGSSDGTIYFEEPRLLATDQARFPHFLALPDALVIIHQDSAATGDEEGEVFLSLQTSADGRQWRTLSRRVGPFSYAGRAEPYIFSAAVDAAGAIYIAVTASAEETIILRSVDGGEGFGIVHRVSTERANVAPRLFVTSDGSMLLFVNQNLGGRQQIVYLVSEDGETWSDPEQLEPDEDVGLTFLPSHTSVGERDYVVYQGLNITARSTYQLYLKTSDDGGRSWSEARRVTTFVDPTQTDNPDLYDNQRPYVASVPGGDSFVLTWERRFQTGSQQVYLLGLNRDGLPDGLLEEVTGRFDLARSPRIIFEGDRPVLVWFTNPQGNSRTVIGRRGVFRWETENLSPPVGEATFAEGVIFNERLHLIWQRRSGAAGSDIVYVEPDQSVREPEILAANFRAGARSGSPVARFEVRDPPDASGIRAYAWTWSRDPESPVPRQIVQRVPERTVVVRAEEDGPWYLRVRSTDFAGNWSEPATMRFELDTTPPPPVSFPPPSVDENGFLASNTFQIGWNPPAGEEGLIAGYSTRLDFFGEDTGVAVDALPRVAVPPRVTTTSESIGRTNVDNGLWVLTVAAVDSVGNIGEARSLPLRLDKYIPVTRVFAAPVTRDLLGRYRMTVLGRGFDSNGTIRRVVLDRDGVPPYDHEFNDWQNDFSVESDGELSGLLIDDFETGVYRIGLLHSERGMYIAPTPITIQARGVIVYGDFRSSFAPRYRFVEGSRTVDTRDIAFYLTVAAAAALMLISTARLVRIGGEIQRLNIEARALVLGADPETLRASAERTRRMRVQGISLRIKFTFFVVLLVIGVVVLVAVVLGRNVLQRQERILVSGLQERIELLVDGQVTGARPALQNPELNLDQLQTIASQGEAMAEAAYVTITGLNGLGELQTIYGTIDPAVIDGAEGRITTDAYTVGVSRLTDEVTPVVDRLAREINAQAAADLGEIPIELERLSQEAQGLILRGAGEEDIARIDQVRLELLRRGRRRLDEIAGPIRSVPEFDFTRLRRDVTSYLFFRPVLDIVPGADAGFEDYYRGTVRVAISTQLILDEIDSTQRDLVLATMVIAALAVAAGVFGAYILATIVVRPINRLVALVEEIGSTDDKTRLKGRELHLKSRDELNVLADSINDMVAGLVKAAEADKDLKFGKETQKAFIPLEPISDDTKRTFGELDEDGIYFFGYYEGAKGVSGDYFTYQKLSDRYYAMIKCDVAGKGIPAALIMVQVATVFQDYFRNWTIKAPGLDLSSLVLRINDIVAERQFKGRFAALTVGILDVEKGAFYLANAGDNQLHIYRASQRAVEQLTIAGGPAAGTFSSADIPVTFPQQMQMIARDDILLLFTDGVEEAKRLLRRADWRAFRVTKEMIDSGDVPEGVVENQDGEEFGIERIHRIVSAVQERGTYRLTKLLDPGHEDELIFDFSTCDNATRDAALAVVAAERVFRLVPDPSMGPESRISIDRVVVDFLRKHFRQFDAYFSHPVTGRSDEATTEETSDGVSRDAPQTERESSDTGQYMIFSHLGEDEQFDDITMLVVRRK